MSLVPVLESICVCNRCLRVIVPATALLATIITLIYTLLQPLVILRSTSDKLEPAKSLLPAFTSAVSNNQTDLLQPAEWIAKLIGLRSKAGAVVGRDRHQGASDELAMRSTREPPPPAAREMMDLEAYNRHMDNYRATIIKDYLSDNSSSARYIVNSGSATGCIWTDSRTAAEKAANMKWKRVIAQTSSGRKKQVVVSPSPTDAKEGPSRWIAEQEPCINISIDSRNTSFSIAARALLSGRDVFLRIPEEQLETNCNALPHLVPYIVCLRHAHLRRCPTRCSWSGNDTSSAIMITAEGSRAISVAKLPSNHSYFGLVGSPYVFECQEGHIELNDADTYRIEALVLYSECKWNDDQSVKSSRIFYRKAATKLVVSPNKSCSSVSHLNMQQSMLPKCLGSDAAQASGRWVVQQEVKDTSQWGNHTAESGQSHWLTPDGMYKPEVKRCPGGHDFPTHRPLVWMPWRCQMLLFRFRSINDSFVRVIHLSGEKGRIGVRDVAYLDCFQKYEATASSGKVYIIGESHAQFVYDHFLASIHPKIEPPEIEYQFTSYCCPLPSMPNAGLIILMIGNWDVAHLGWRPLNETLLCIDRLVLQLSKWQAAGVEVRLGTPLSRHLPHAVPFRVKDHKRWGLDANRKGTWKATQLMGQGVRNSARKYGVPVWDILQLTTGREMNSGGDFCGHYNAHTYYVLSQVLCNSIAPAGVGS